MLRFRFKRQVRLGHFPKALEAAEDLTALQREQVWPEGRTGFGGPVNTLITEMEFPSLASLEAYMEKSDADAEHIKLRQKAAEHSVEGSTRVEILKSAAHLERDESRPLVAHG